MIKKILFFLPFLVLLSCKKQETPNATFTLTATLHGSNSVLLQWPATNLTGFKNISIYRSGAPIPDPTFDKPIDGNLQIGLISDNTVTSYLDSAINVGSSGTAYYKVILNLDNRFITSNQAEMVFNAFSVDLPNSNNGQFSSSFIVKRIPEFNLLYIFDFSQDLMTVVNYSSKKIIASTSFFTSNSNFIYACVNNNNPELFVYSNNSIVCYNGLTLTQKYSVNIVSSFYDFKVKNGFLYVLANPYIYTYNLSTLSLVSQTSLPNQSYITSNNLFVSNQSNALYFKCYTELYNSQYGGYSYTNKITAYNIANGVPIGATNLNIPVLNGDTTNSGNISNNSLIQMSPNGKYVTYDQAGDIYSISDNSVHSIRSANNFNPTPVFSNDGDYILSKSSSNSTTGQSFGVMDIYILPGFTLVNSLTSQNPSSSLITFADDFMDNDTLLSYNISQNFVNNQTSKTLTVLFKKVD